MRRATLVVLDSLGIGAMPDAPAYGDLGAHTLDHIVERVPTIKIPNLVTMGLGNIQGVTGLRREALPTGSFARLKEISNGKDTMTGHWELAGLKTETPFLTFPNGFPAAFMAAFEERIGRKTLGNIAASGTEIIDLYAEEQKKTGSPIVYTSADSVFQVAANTAVISLEELYRICEIAREMLIGEYQVGRVIARPYFEENGKYTRTADRKDYAVSPHGRTVLDFVKESGKRVHAVGKIEDIFNGQGITTAIHTKSNMDGVDQTIQALKEDFEGLIFTNLVDFDTLYGHRRDPAGYANALEEFDARLPELLSAMNKDDVLILTADHGTDPGYQGWDHTREYVPMLICGKQIKAGLDLGTLESFASVGATIAALLGVEKPSIGTDVSDLLIDGAK